MSEVIEQALSVYLQSQNALTDIVGGPGSTPPTIPRIFPLVLRQDNLQLPAITYHVVVGESGLAIDGNPTRKAFKRIQINAWSNQRFQAENIIEILRGLLLGFIGQWDQLAVSVVAFERIPEMFDHISKVSHSGCQISLFHDE